MSLNQPRRQWPFFLFTHLFCTVKKKINNFFAECIDLQDNYFEYNAHYPTLIRSILVAPRTFQCLFEYI